MFSEDCDDYIIQKQEDCDEMLFIDRQFVLMVADDFKSVSLRKITDLSKSLLFYEHHKAMTWVLKMHDNSLKKS